MNPHIWFPLYGRWVTRSQVGVTEIEYDPADIRSELVTHGPSALKDAADEPFEIDIGVDFLEPFGLMGPVLLIVAD